MEVEVVGTGGAGVAVEGGGAGRTVEPRWGIGRTCGGEDESRRWPRDVAGLVAWDVDVDGSTTGSRVRGGDMPPGGGLEAAKHTHTHHAHA